MIKPIVNTVRAFDIDCAGESATTYTGTATGKAAEGMSGFAYTINQANVKASTISGLRLVGQRQLLGHPQGRLLQLSHESASPADSR